jgi:hypothetical protein
LLILQCLLKLLFIKKRHIDVFETGNFEMKTYNWQKKRDEAVFIQKTIGNIQRIKPFIHKVKFSSQQYDYGDYQNQIGRLQIASPEYNHQIPNYRKAAFRQMKHGRIVVYFDPLIPGMPLTYIMPSSAEFKLLYELYKKMPDLSLSYIEYTIDLFCKNHFEVADLFYVLRKNIYFPWANNTITRGGRLTGIDLNRTTNALFQVNAQSRTRYLKIYERGNDENKKFTPKRNIGRWNHKDCDRVRIEYVYKKNKLNKKGPYSLKNLFEDVNFLQIIGLDKKTEGRKSINEIRFKKFKEHRDLPQYWDDYKAETNNKSNCFIETYIHSRKNGIANVNQYIEDHDHFNALKREIDNKIIKYNKKWIKRNTRITS